MNPFRRKPAPPAATPSVLEETRARIHGVIKAAEGKAEETLVRLREQLAELEQEPKR